MPGFRNMMKRSMRKDGGVASRFKAARQKDDKAIMKKKYGLTEGQYEKFTKPSMTLAQKEKAMETLKKYKGETKKPVQKRTMGPTKGTPMSRTKKGVGGAVRLGSAGMKYLKNNPDKVKKIMNSDLPKKTKDMLSKMKKSFSKKKK